MLIAEKLRNHLILEQFSEKLAVLQSLTPEQEVQAVILSTDRDQSNGKTFIEYIQHLNDQ